MAVDAAEMVGELRGAPLLRGYRGAPVVERPLDNLAAQAAPPPETQCKARASTPSTSR